MLKNQCVAILTKNGTIGWTWKTAFTQYTTEMRAEISKTALFTTQDNLVEADIQKKAEQAIAAEASRWVGIQVPNEE